MPSVEDVPHQSKIPFNIWPPIAGWNKVTIINTPHDGDTVTVGFIIPVTARLAKIDAPELNTEAGLKSKEALVTCLQTNKIYTVWLYGREKYGRTLMEFFDENGHSVNKWMVDNGYAKPWDGKGARPATNN